MVEPLGKAIGHGALHIAKQHDAVAFRAVFGPVHIGLVKDHAFAFAPAVGRAVDFDHAAVVIGCQHSQVVAQRSGIGVAVQIEFGAGGQLGKHGGFHAGDGFDQRRGLGAQLHGRGVGIAVPLQIKALPAGFEEGVEACIVVVGGGLDLHVLLQIDGFLADFAPVGLQRGQLGEGAGGQVGRAWHLAEHQHEDVEWRCERGVVKQLLDHFVTHLAAQVHVQRAAEEHEHQGQNDDFCHRLQFYRGHFKQVMAQVKRQCRSL